MSINSDKQFALAFQLPNNRLIRLIHKFLKPIKHRIIKKHTKKWIKLDLVDEEIYVNLSKLLMDETESVTSSDDEKKTDIKKTVPYRWYKKRWIVVRNAIGKTKTKINTYLDYGCGECDITEYLGQKLGLDKKHTLGVDIEGWMDTLYDSPKPDTITFTQIKSNGQLPYKTNSIDLITLFQVLHHVQNIEEPFEEIMRVLKPGGVIVIREHNCQESDEVLAALIDIEHGLYDIVTRGIPYKDFIKQHYAKYRSINDWKDFLSYGGRNKFLSEDIDDKSITKYFYLAYQKT